MEPDYTEISPEELLSALFAPAPPEERLARIEVCRTALAAVSREDDPLFWGSLQEALGILLADNPFVDPADEEAAIEALEQAAEVFAHEGERPSWAGALANLANIHLGRQIDRASSVRRAQELLEQALEGLTSDDLRTARAQVQITLANTWRSLFEGGGPPTYLATAAVLLEEALCALDPEETPEAWAEAWNSTGLTWAERPSGDLRANEERALAAFAQALQVQSAAEAPWDRARTLANRAGLQRNRISGKRSRNLEDALADCREAIRLLGSDGPPDLRVLALVALGHVLVDRSQGDPGQNIEQALTAYDEALSLCEPERSPDDWREALLGHANALRDHVLGDRESQIEKALAEYDQILELLDRTGPHFERAFVFVEQADAWRARLRGDRGDNMERCRSCLFRALEIWTPESAPVQWANAQMNLGNAWYFRILGSRDSNLEKALEAYDQALTILEPNHIEYDLALTQSNRAMVYRARTAGDRSDNIDRAVEASQQALSVFSLDEFPFERARTLNNLGAIYLLRGEGEREEDLARSLQAFEEALQVRRRETVPAAWATSTIGLARALSSLAEARDDDAGSSQARRLLTEVLRESTPGAAPSICLSAAFPLGILLARRGLWQEAVSAFEVALQAAAILRQASALRVSRHAEMFDAEDLHRWAASALAHAGDPRSAAVTLERGRAQGLGTALERNRVDPERIRNADSGAWDLFEHAAARVRRTEIEERELAAEGEDHPAARPSVRAEALQAGKNLTVAIERIRRLPGLSSFLGEPGLDEIAAATLPDRPLVYLTPTPEAILALLAWFSPKGSGEDAPIEVEALWIESFPASRVDRLLEPRNRASELDEILSEVTELVEPLAARLRDLASSAVVLIPSGVLGLLPLHAPLLELFNVSYAPSARVLTAARKNLEHRPAGPPVLVGAGGPESESEPLAWAAAELTGIFDLFAATSRHAFLGKAATREALLGALPLGTHIHFACHGAFDQEEPLNSHLRLTRSELSLRDLLAGTSLAASRLVTLSACHSATTDLLRLPDEVLGLPAGFLQAGAPCVIGSLWEANDLTTTLLMEKLYQLHLRGNAVTGEPPLPPVRALRQAQTWLRKVTAAELAAEMAPRRSLRDAFAAEVVNRMAIEDDDARPFASPYFWAPFVLLGEGS